MVPLARLIHSLPGRKRIKIDEKRGDEAYFMALKEELADCPDILTVEANHLTGTVLVHHRADDPGFWHYAAEHGLFHFPKNESSGHALPPFSVGATRVDGQKPHAKPSNGLNMRLLIFLGMMGMGIVQTIKGNIAIPAIAAFWYAFSSWPGVNGVNPESPFLEAEFPEES